VNDAKFHPINGNILVAMDTEIVEIDHKDGHTIRVFEGPSKIDEGMYIAELQISPDGNIIITNGLQKYSGIYYWDYNKGKLIDSLNYFSLNGRFYPDNETMLFWARPMPGSLKEGIVKYNYKNKGVLLEKELRYEEYLQIAALSKDGTKLALALSHGNPKDGWNFSMELWNAETLTTIKSFGSPGDIHEFRDVQISDDNQYVGFRGDNLLFLYTITGKELKIPLQKYVYSFAFTPNCKFITLDIETIDNQENVYIYELSSLNKSYMYTNIFPRIMRYNTNNDFFISKMRLYSNHWYEVGVNNPIETESILYPNPTTDYITVRNTLACSLQEIEIYNIFGVCVLTVETQNFVSLQKIDVSSLPPGVYIVRVGNEKPMKFSVVR
jgi:WD40 repeat protein